MLELYFQNTADVYVSGNLMFYYEEGEPSSVTSPDVFVVKGVAKGLRRTYKLWEEQQPPCVVIEVSSRSTRLEDKGNKRALYAMLGVHEYFLFDPLREYLKPPLQGFRLQNDEYVSITSDARGALVSEELGLRLHQEGSRLRLTDMATDQPLLRPAEIEAARRAADEQAQAEAEARRAAEEEVARLRSELARLRGEQTNE